jgi:hypothetical protein
VVYVSVKEQTGLKPRGREEREDIMVSIRFFMELRDLYPCTLTKLADFISLGVPYPLLRWREEKTNRARKASIGLPDLRVLKEYNVNTCQSLLPVSFMTQVHTLYVLMHDILCDTCPYYYSTTENPFKSVA